MCMWDMVDQFLSRGKPMQLFFMLLHIILAYKEYRKSNQKGED